MMLHLSKKSISLTKLKVRQIRIQSLLMQKKCILHLHHLFFKEGKKEFRPPPPEHTPNPSKRRWESMDREEQQDYYFEKKEAFIDYMDDTFEVRLEQSLFEICE